MVSLRCKMAVKFELDRLGLHYTKVGLGEVEIMENLTEEQTNQLKFELLQLSNILLLHIKSNVLKNYCSMMNSI